MLPPNRLLATYVAFIISQARALEVANPAWRDSADITIPTTDRVAIAQAAIEKTLSVVVDKNGKLAFEDMNYGAMGRFFSHMAEFDFVTNQSIYKNRLLDFFPQALEFRKDFMHVSINVGLAHGIAAVRAYQAYSDGVFLEWAKLSWAGGKLFTISKDELANEKIPNKNFTLPSTGTCSGLSLAGGTFWQNKSDNVYMNSLSTGSFLITTSMLLEATQDDQAYRHGALGSVTFFLAHLMNTQGVMLDGISPSDCAASGKTYPVNAGIMIEGLAMLSSIVPNQTVQDSLSLLVEASLSNTGWHNADGVLSWDTFNKTQVTAELVSQYIVRGLSAIYTRNTTRSSLRNYIRGYLGVQYNAVLKNARHKDTDIYDAAWTGPLVQTNFSIENQTDALSILIAAIPIKNDTDDTVPFNPPPPSRKSATNVGAIAGGICGGLVFLLAIVLAIVIRKRRSRRASEVEVNPETPPNGIQPFEVSEKSTHSLYKPSTSLVPRATVAPTRSSTAPTTTSWSTDSFTSASLSTAAVSAIPTDELMMMLHERVEGQEWLNEEPPDYATQVGSLSRSTTRRES